MSLSLLHGIGKDPRKEEHQQGWKGFPAKSWAERKHAGGYKTLSKAFLLEERIRLRCHQSLSSEISSSCHYVELHGARQAMTHSRCYDHVWKQLLWVVIKACGANWSKYRRSLLDAEETLLTKKLSAQLLVFDTSDQLWVITPAWAGSTQTVKSAVFQREH